MRPTLKNLICHKRLFCGIMSLAILTSKNCSNKPLMENCGSLTCHLMCNRWYKRWISTCIIGTTGWFTLLALTHKSLSEYSIAKCWNNRLTQNYDFDEDDDLPLSVFCVKTLVLLLTTWVNLLQFHLICLLNILVAEWNFLWRYKPMGWRNACTK